MQPSSGDAPSTTSNPWRRWGPIVAIVAVIAIIAGILIFASSGDDSNGSAATTGAASAGTTGAGSGSSEAAGTTAAGGGDERGRSARRDHVQRREGSGSHRPHLHGLMRHEHGTSEDPGLLRAAVLHERHRRQRRGHGAGSDRRHHHRRRVHRTRHRSDPRLHHRRDLERRHRRASEADVPGLHRHDERPVPDVRAQGRAEVPRRVGHLRQRHRGSCRRREGR